jgi:hypothetical protein
MGFFKNMRCGVGAHNGTWEYDYHSSCGQTLRCTECGAERTRTHHQHGSWSYRDTTGCWSERTCSRCGDTETELRHHLTWTYFADALRTGRQGDSTLARAFGAATASMIPACRQVLVCDRCGHVDASTTIDAHAWNSWSGGTRTCGRCGERETR